jgi:hypothetical protein
MKLRKASLVVGLLSLALSQVPLTVAQTTTEAASALPRVVRFSGTVKDLDGNSMTGVVGVTFALYSEQTGGATLWLETQNVSADRNGHYVALLGSIKPDGLPTELFTSGQARWVGVQVSGQAEQPRVLLVSAPYAFKAGDAETIGGLPASAFVLANGSQGSGAKGASNPVAVSAQKNTASPANPNVTGKGVVNYIPMWNTTSDIVDSIIFQKGSAVGINTTTPAVKLDVNGKSDIRDTLTLFPKATDSTLAINGTAFKIDQTGQVTFITGQTFPGTGSGTVTSVGLGAPSTDFTVSGSPVTTAGTLKFAWNVAPTNSNTANAIVKRDASGNFSAGVITATDANLSDVLSITSAATNPLFVSTSASTGATAVYGVATSTTTTGTAFGVEGVTAGSSNTSYGVVGFAVAASGTPYGVYGLANSPTAFGVFGQNAKESATGKLISDVISGGGVWGDAGPTFANGGIVGTADDGYSGVFYNDSPSGITTLLVESLNSSSLILDAEGPTGSCWVEGSGNLSCSGTKNAVVPLDGGKRSVALSAIESPQNWFEDTGAAELVNGTAVVTLDSDFIQTVNSEMDYKVFPVPNEDCKGLYVTNKTAKSFEVRELGGGTSSIRFDYRIMALRRKYENVRFADRTRERERQKRMRERAHAATETQPQSHTSTKELSLAHPIATTMALK